MLIFPSALNKKLQWHNSSEIFTLLFLLSAPHTQYNNIIYIYTYFPTKIPTIDLRQRQQWFYDKDVTTEFISPEHTKKRYEHTEDCPHPLSTPPSRRRFSCWITALANTKENCITWWRWARKSQPDRILILLEFIIHHCSRVAACLLYKCVQSMMECDHSLWPLSNDSDWNCYIFRNL